MFAKTARAWASDGLQMGWLAKAWDIRWDGTGLLIVVVFLVGFFFYVPGGDAIVQSGRRV